MKRFTTSERRGTIVLMLIMAVVVLFLAVGQGVHRSVPEAREASVENVAAPFESTAAGESEPKHRRDTAKTSRRRGGKKRAADKAGSSKKATRDAGRSRSPLDEPVDGRR